MRFDFGEINSMIDELAYNEDTDKIAQKLSDSAAYIRDALNDEYINNEINRVMDCFQNCTTDDFGEIYSYNADNVKEVRGIKKPDIAYIAAHVGFIAGILYAENERFNFYNGNTEIGE